MSWHVWRRLAAGALMICIWIGAAASNQDDRGSPEDYAFGIPLTVGGGGSIHEAVLPEPVYRALRQDNMGDIAVFDAAGIPVLFGLAQPNGQPQRTRVIRINAFAIDVPVAGTGEELQIALRRNAAGRIEFAETVAAGTPTERQYVLNATHVKEAFSSLAFSWKRPHRNFVRQVVIEAGDDLNQWQELSKPTTIADLRQEHGKILRHNRVSFPVTRARYLRVRFVGAPQTGDTPELESASVELSSGETPPRPHQMVLEPTLVKGEATRYMFTLPAGLNSGRFRIDFGQPETYFHVQFWNRAKSHDDWISRGQFTVYDLTAGGRSIRDDGVGVWGHSNRYWSFAPASDGAGFRDAVPVVKLQWQPHILVFVGRGQEPYLLAFGAEKPGPAPPDARLVLRQVGLAGTLSGGTFGLPKATLGALEELAGEAAYHPPFWATNPRQWILWAVLLLAVAALLWMALRLLRSDAGKGKEQQPYN